METSLTAAMLMAFLNTGTPSTPEPIVIHTYPAIAGLWQMDLGRTDLRQAEQERIELVQADLGQATNLKSCQERYNFAEDGKLNTTSGDELTMGEYSFSYVPESELPIIATHTVYDNNGVDCSGNKVNQTGETMASFVRLDNKHSPTVMYWCSDKDGKDCPARLQRVLP